MRASSCSRKKVPWLWRAAVTANPEQIINEFASPATAVVELLAENSEDGTNCLARGIRGWWDGEGFSRGLISA
ncbi:hypothetical protein FYJ24_00550 [Actinomycetaceae bacterium WB03_NA08]|uniref:Uncharacterized protein n=1 Tax=Scrofimicrobium canadense TaxID=2652290 RepID=A0A6N7VNJ3_9ACTO|nr:hypothetical protein [Scrofimicrobium canadense]MSS83279.1 hypothetical protein [Scrofimicrobium canadense]